MDPAYPSPASLIFNTEKTELCIDVAPWRARPAAHDVDAVPRSTLTHSTEDVTLHLCIVLFASDFLRDFVTPR